MRSLDEIGVAYGSDRSSLRRNHLESYEELFGNLRSHSFSLLDVGSRNSAHAAIWTEFFPRAQVFLLTSESIAKADLPVRATALQPSEFTREAVLEAVAAVRPLLVFDDGSHKEDGQAIALDAIFPVLAPGGYFVIENLRSALDEGDENLSLDEADKNPSAQRFEAAALMRELAMAAAGRAPTGEGGACVSIATAEAIRRVSFEHDIAILQKSSVAGVAYKRTDVDRLPDTRTAWVTEVEPYTRVDGRLIDASPWVTTAFERLKAEGVVRLPPAISGEVEDLTVVFGGLAVDNHSNIVSESLNCVQNLSETPVFHQLPGKQMWLSKRDLSEATAIPAREAGQYVLLKSAWDSNYGHWLYDSLSRLQLVHTIKSAPERTFIVVNRQVGAMEAVVADSLRLAGIDPADVVVHDGRIDMRYQSIVIPGMLSRHPLYKAPAATRYLEWLGRDIDPGPVEKIYLSRNSYSRRKLLNEDELWPLLQDEGFTRVSTEELTLAEQIKLFKGASVVAGNMGAAFSNLAFSPKGVRVLPLATQTMPHDFFYDIVCHKSGRYLGVQGRVGVGAPGMASDFVVAAASLSRALREIQA